MPWPSLKSLEIQFKQAEKEFNEGVDRLEQLPDKENASPEQLKQIRKIERERHAANEKMRKMMEIQAILIDARYAYVQQFERYPTDDELSTFIESRQREVDEILRKARSYATPREILIRSSSK